MKNSLSSFGEQELSEKYKSEQSKFSSQTTNDDIFKQYDKIKDMSQSEASAALAEEVLRQKQNGSFDFDALLAQVEGLKGYLPDKDYENLKRILNTLR